MTLAKKTVVTYLLIAIVPMAVVGGFIWELTNNSFNELGEYAKNGLKHAAIEKVDSIRKMKQEQITSFFDSRKSDLNVISNEVASLMELPVMKNNGDPMSKRQLRIEMSFYAGMLENFCREYGYANLYLFAPSGYCFYAVDKNGIVKSKLLEEEYKDTPLAEALRRSQKEKGFGFTDYELFSADGKEAYPYAFMVMPVVVKNDIIMYLGLQLGTDLVNSMMAKGGSVENRVESYLVGLDGYMRSDTLLSPEEFGVANSFLNDAKISGVTEKLTQGQSGAGIGTNYLGDKVISSYAVMDIFGNKWAVICDENYEHAMAASSKMDTYIAAAGSSVKKSSIVIALVISLIVVILAFLLSRVVTKPIIFAGNMIDVLAERVYSLSNIFSSKLALGDWDVEISDIKIPEEQFELLQRSSKRKDEFGAMSRSQLKIVEAIHENIEAVNKIIENVTIALLQVRATSNQVAIGAGQLSDSSAILSDGATDQAKSMAQVSESISNISKHNLQRVKQTEEGLEIVKHSNEKITLGNARISEMMSAINSIEESSKEIRIVTKIIEDIAFQTNLLAINAAVEAARAGQHGKGFAVVAEEVRTLATRSAEAAQQTVGLIANSEKAVKSGVGIAEEVVTTFSDIALDIGNISEIIDNIYVKTNSENESLNESSEALSAINVVTQTNTAGAEETASAAAEMQVTVDMLNEILSEFTLNEDIDCESNINILTAGNRAKAELHGYLGKEYEQDEYEEEDYDYDYEEYEEDEMPQLTVAGLPQETA